MSFPPKKQKHIKKTTHATYFVLFTKKVTGPKHLHPGCATGFCQKSSWHTQKICPSTKTQPKKTMKKISRSKKHSHFFRAFRWSFAPLHEVRTRTTTRQPCCKGKLWAFLKMAWKMMKSGMDEPIPGNSLCPFQRLSDLQLGDQKVTWYRISIVLWLVMFVVHSSLGSIPQVKVFIMCGNLPKRVSKPLERVWIEWWVRKCGSAWF